MNLKLLVALLSVCFSVACSQKALSPTAEMPKRPGTIKDLMVAGIDPAADGVWNAVSSIITVAGIEEIQPHTDQEWAAVRNHAIDLINASILLAEGGRPVAAKGAKSENPGVEESPEVIQQLITDNPAVFTSYALQLKARAQEALAAIDAKNPTNLLEVGGRLDEVCEACHKTFWYPNQFKK
jgi:hypothetical protein